MVFQNLYLSKVFVYFHIVSSSTCLALFLEECNKPLGISTGEIPDEALTASSSHDLIVGPHRARLGREEGGGAWCPRGMVDKYQREYLEVALGTVPRLVTGIGTQGRFANNFGVEFTPAFTIEFVRPGTDKFIAYALPTGSNRTVVLTGNTDTYTEIRNELEIPILATRVRIRPISAHPRVVCLRLELYGCKNSEDLNYYKVEGKDFEYHVGEGSIFDGSVTSSSLLKEVASKEFQNGASDSQAQDGDTSNSESQNSTTKTKTQKANEDEKETYLQRSYDDDYNDDDDDDYLNTNNSLSPELPPGEVVLPETPLNATFVFLSIRNFSKIHLYIDPIHTLMKGRQPLLTVSLRFAAENRIWIGPPLTVNFFVHSTLFNLTVNILGRSAQILNMYLAIEDAELILQEVYFDSVACDCPPKTPAVTHPSLSSKKEKEEEEGESVSALNTLINKPTIDYSIFKSTLSKFKQISKSALGENYENKSVTKFNFDVKEPNSMGAIRKISPTNRESSGREKIIDFAPKINVQKKRNESIVISGDKSKESEQLTTQYKEHAYQREPAEEKGTTTVWVVHTASTHRTYVGVTIGFSVGVVLLLSVWLWLWARSGRTKANSPRMFRRSPPADTLDMTCLMEGNVIDWGSSSPTSEENKDIHGISISSSIRRDHKNQDDASKTPLVSTLPPYKISTINSTDSKGSSLYSYPLHYGYSLTRDIDVEIHRKNSFFAKHRNTSSLSKVRHAKPLTHIQIECVDVEAEGAHHGSHHTSLLTSLITHCLTSQV